MDVVLLVDVSNLYCANNAKLGHLQRKSDGYSTGGLYGSIRSIHALEDQIKACRTYMCFDGEMAGAHKRSHYVSQYKADRTGGGCQWVDGHREALHRWSVLSGRTVGSHTNSEADDVIAFFHHVAKNDVLLYNPTFVIMSKDHDMKQLLDEDTIIRSRKDEKAYDLMDFELEFGFKPERYAAYLALAGDATDNVPAVVSAKDAKMLVQESDDLSDVINRLVKLLGGEEQAAQAVRNFNCVQLAPDKSPVNVWPGDFDEEMLREWYEEYEMASLIKRMDKKEYCLP